MMYYGDHAPAHFHARYGEHEALIQISPLGIQQGFLPPRVLSLVIEWALIHQKELLEDWERAKTNQKLQKIAPLA